MFLFFPLMPSFCNMPWAVESPICDNHLKASILHFGLCDWLHLQSILWYSQWKILDERRCFTGRQWQHRESKTAADFLPHPSLALISACKKTRSEPVKLHRKKLSFSNRKRVTETIQSKECKIKWQDFNWVFIYKTGQMASVAPCFLLVPFVRVIHPNCGTNKKRTGSCGMCCKSSLTPLHLQWT